MARLKADNMRGIELKVAAAICQAQKQFNWRYLKDVEGNPSTAYAYYDYLKMARAAVRTIEKLYAGGQCGKWLKEQK